MSDKLLLAEIDDIYQKILAQSKTDNHGIYWDMHDVSNPTKINDSIYTGVAGVILFLIEYYKIKKESSILDVIERSSDWLMNSINKEVSGNYAFLTGKVGGMYTLLKAGNLLKKTTLTKFYLRHLIELKEYSKQTGNKLDFLNGFAGTALGLLHIYNETRDLDIKQIIHDLLRHVISNTSIHDFGFSWERSGKSIKSLCGFSHGSAGIGFVFLEMAIYFQNDLFYHIAERAFDYEDNFYNKQLHNWPDFRKAIYNEQTKVLHLQNYQRNNLDFFTRPTYMKAWCHGAPGILLTRIRAFEILKKEKYKNTILHCLEEPINGSLLHVSETICHGRLGNSAVYLEMYKHFGELKYLELFKNDCYSAIQNKTNIGFYKSGLKEIQTEDLSLFNGISGIGYSFIQALSPTVDSLLYPKVRQNIMNEKFTGFNMSDFSKIMFSKYFPNTESILKDSSKNVISHTKPVLNIDSIASFSGKLNGEVKFIYELEKRKCELGNLILSYSLLNVEALINATFLERSKKGGDFKKYKFILNSLVEFVYNKEKSLYFLLYPDIIEFKLLKIDKSINELLKFLNVARSFEDLNYKYEELKSAYSLYFQNSLEDFLIKLIKYNIVNICNDRH